MPIILSMTASARNTEVSAHDERGYWTVRAYGVAGEWFACSRTLETAIGLATYASLIGESPRNDWEPEDWTPRVAPYSLATSEAEACADFARNEAIERAHINGTLVTDAPYADDRANLTDDQWARLHSGAIIPLLSGEYMMLNGDGYARRFRAGVTYTERDGSSFSRALDGASARV